MLKNAAILLGLVVGLPYLVNFAFRVEHVVHTTGAVFITGASSGIGKDGCLELADTTNFTGTFRALLGL